MFDVDCKSNSVSNVPYRHDLWMKALRASNIGTFRLPFDGTLASLSRSVESAETCWFELPAALTGGQADAVALKCCEFWESVVPEDREAVQTLLINAIATQESVREAEVRVVVGGQAARWLHMTLDIVRSLDGTPMFLDSVVRDVSPERYAAAELEVITERLRMALEASGMGMFGDAVGLKNVPLGPGPRPGWQLNAAALYGIAADCPATLHDLVDRMHPDDRAGVFESHRRMMERHNEISEHEYRVIWPDGSLHWLLAKATSRIDPASGLPVSTGVVLDITERKATEQRIAHLASHDQLTGLPNRALFNQLLQQALESRRKSNERFAVMFIDLDRFKIINDTLGHAAGDQLIRTVARRFRDALRASDVVARLGGDEFVVLATEIESEADACAVARKLLHTAIAPINLQGQEVRVTASIGVCLVPDHGDDASTLLQNADVAMYQAKESGKNDFRFFTDQSPQAMRRLAVENRIAYALERKEFSLRFQPQVDSKTCVVNGVEALLRWRNPGLGEVGPDVFIPILEETGAIVEVGRWVMRSACAQAMAWRRLGCAPISMAVNVSARQFADRNLLSDIRAALLESGMEPEQLEIELTEGMMMRDPDAALKTLNGIRALGVKIAIDDFGTGYSSLSQLRRFPLDTLKIDRSFVQKIHADQNGQAITAAISAIGRTLSLKVVAEGVETAEEADYLRRELACDDMQGYYFSRPILPDDVTPLLPRMVVAQRSRTRSGVLALEQQGVN